MTKTMIRVAPTVTLLLAAAPVAMAAESDISIDRTGVQIVGTLNLPDGVENPPVVLMLHGFTGSRNEFPVAGGDVGLFTHAAAKLAEAGIASLRIDFTGSGQSGGAWEDTTFSTQIADAVSAFDYLQTLDGVDGDRVAILGYSQGGLVASHAAELRPETAPVVLWAPVTNPLDTYAGLVTQEVVDRALAAPADEEITAPLSWGGETTLKARFFQELVTTSPVAALSGYPGPVAVIVGTKETIVAPQPAAGQVLLNYHDGEEILVEVDSNHDWNALKTFETVDTVLLPATVDWLKGHF
jgi:pimeloyl-ACP methyl ester carboxylesterase